MAVLILSSAPAGAGIIPPSSMGFGVRFAFSIGSSKNTERIVLRLLALAKAEFPVPGRRKEKLAQHEREKPNEKDGGSEPPIANR